MKKDVEMKEVMLNKVYTLKADTPTRKKGEIFIHRVDRGRETKKVICLQRWYLRTDGEWDYVTLWMPKSQIEYSDHKVTMPAWLYNKHSFDLLELD